MEMAGRVERHPALFETRVLAEGLAHVYLSPLESRRAKEEMKEANTTPGTETCPSSANLSARMNLQEVITHQHFMA